MYLLPPPPPIEADISRHTSGLLVMLLVFASLFSRCWHRMGGSLTMCTLTSHALIIFSVISSLSASPLPEIQIVRRPQQTPRDAREVSSV